MINIWRQPWLSMQFTVLLQSSVGVQRALRCYCCPALLYRPAGSRNPRNRQTLPYSDLSGDSGVTSHPCRPSMLIQLERFNFTVQVKKSGRKQLQSTHVSGQSSAAAARLAARPRAVTERPTPAVLRRSPKRGRSSAEPATVIRRRRCGRSVYSAGGHVLPFTARARTYTHTSPAQHVTPKLAG